MKRVEAMPTVKHHLKEIAAALPDDATLEDALKAVYFCMKAEHPDFRFDPRKSLFHAEMARVAEGWETELNKETQ